MWKDMLSVANNYLMQKSHFVHFLTGTNGHPVYSTECGLQGKVPYNFSVAKQSRCKKCEAAQHRAKEVIVSATVECHSLQDIIDSLEYGWIGCYLDKAAMKEVADMVNSRNTRMAKRENFCELHNTNYVLVGYCPICHPKGL